MTLQEVRSGPQMKPCEMTDGSLSRILSKETGEPEENRQKDKNKNKT